MTSYFLPCIFWILIIFGFDAPYIAVMTILAAGIHELGHISAMLLFKNLSPIPSGHLSGFRIKNISSSSYLTELTVLAAGPLMNLATYLILLPFSCTGGYLYLFSIINAATGLSNLLPAEGYDGYGILKELLEWHGRSTLILDRISFMISVFFTFFSLYMIGRYGTGYWIFCVFFLSLLLKMNKMIKLNIF